MKSIPMTPSQKRYSSLYKSNPSCVLNNLTFSLKVGGFIDLDRFIAAVKVVLVNRSLLNAICDLNAFQYTLKNVEHDRRIKVIEIPQGENQKKFVIDQAREQNAQSFNVENEPLYRLCIIRGDSNCHYLTFTFIHTIADGIGIHFFIKDVFKQYEHQLFTNTLVSQSHENDLSLKANSEWLLLEDDQLTSWWAKYYEGKSIDFGQVTEFTNVGFIGKPFKVLNKPSLNKLTSKMLEGLISADDTRKLAVQGSYFFKEVLGNRDKGVEDFNCYIDLLPFTVDTNTSDNSLLDKISLNRIKAKEHKLPYWCIVDNVSSDLYSHPYGVANIEINLRFLRFGPSYGDLDLEVSVMKESLFQTGGIMSDICLVIDSFEDNRGFISFHYNKSRLNESFVATLFEKMIWHIQNDAYLGGYLEL